jgi:hypothetical protein
MESMNPLIYLWAFILMLFGVFTGASIGYEVFGS